MNQENLELVEVKDGRIRITANVSLHTWEQFQKKMQRRQNGKKETVLFAEFAGAEIDRLMGRAVVEA